MDQKQEANPPSLKSHGSSRKKTVRFSDHLPKKGVNPCMKLVKDVWLSESKKSNLVFSPSSIDTSPGLLTPGATLKQLLGFLNCESLNNLNSIHSQITNTKAQTGPKAPKLSFAGSAWVSPSLKPAFPEVAHAVYKAETVDFANKSGAGDVLKMINTWAKEETNGLIQDYLPADAINEHTAFVLTNALYYKGFWSYPNQFTPSLTKVSKFYLHNREESVNVPFMSSRRDQHISCYDNFKVLKLPYKGDVEIRQEFSMYIVLPEKSDGLGELIETVSSDPAGFLNQYLPACHQSVRTGEFKIPKFKICFDFEAKSVLQKVGLACPAKKKKKKKVGLALPSDESKAAVTKMPNTDSRLRVEGVHHKCFVGIDEDGTEAAASTTVVGQVMWAKSSPSPPSRPPVDFVADHPFMFIIKEEQSGAVLFMGHVLDPSLNC